GRPRGSPYRLKVATSSLPPLNIIMQLCGGSKARSSGRNEMPMAGTPPTRPKGVSRTKVDYHDSLARMMGPLKFVVFPWSFPRLHGHRLQEMGHLGSLFATSD
ncbi:hypothetical protein CLAIMM_08980, partial [Cladophialophora immunda]